MYVCMYVSSSVRFKLRFKIRFKVRFKDGSVPVRSFFLLWGLRVCELLHYKGGGVFRVYHFLMNTENINISPLFVPLLPIAYQKTYRKVASSQSESPIMPLPSLLSSILPLPMSLSLSLSLGLHTITWPGWML